MFSSNGRSARAFDGGEDGHQMKASPTVTMSTPVKTVRRLITAFIGARNEPNDYGDCQNKFPKRSVPRRFGTKPCAGFSRKTRDLQKTRYSITLSLRERAGVRGKVPLPSKRTGCIKVMSSLFRGNGTGNATPRWPQRFLRQQDYVQSSSRSM